MQQTLKAAVLRSYYRFANWQAWRAGNVHGTPGALELPGPAGPVRAHLYRGEQATERPLVVYFHGGGWVLGDLQTHHAYCSALAGESGASIIAVDYRRLPEHPFPAAQDDCLTAVTAIAERHADFGGDSGGLILAGDSAGGHLARHPGCLPRGQQGRTDHESGTHPESGTAHGCCDGSEGGRFTESDRALQAWVGSPASIVRQQARQY